MAVTSSLSFAPTLHQITPERVAFVYNTNDPDSLEVAQYYRDQREVPNANLIGLSISVPTAASSGTVCEDVILDEADYLYQIETPLIAALEVLGADFGTDGANPIWVIILGYNIPLTYNDGGEQIAIASRLHRLKHPVSHKRKNHTYDRRSFQFFDGTDATEVYLTAVLDGPTKEAVKKLIDRSLDVSNQTFVTGDLVIDPYGKQESSEDIRYENEIRSFIDDEVPNLGLDSQVTVDVDDPYQEPTVASFSHDSFYWGWYNQTYAPQLFLNQNERRVFLYNADDRAACNIHYFESGSAFDPNGSDFWCNIAINLEPGYASCAGAIDDPGSDAFLRPIPFFRALHQGSTLAEAFLFASEFVSWKTVLIGDPLMTVNFPVDIPSDQDTTFQLIPNDEAIVREKEFIEDSLAWGERQTRVLRESRAAVVSSIDFTEELNLLIPINRWFNLKDTKAQTDIHTILVSRWLRYIQATTNLSVDQWLDENLEKISFRLQEVISESGVALIPDTKVYDRGFWEFTFTFIHNELTLENIFFELEVSRNSSFDSGSILVDVSSITDVTGWKYEGQPFLFIQMPDSGFPSNFSGRRVRFSSPQSNFLQITEVYYVRWTAIDSSGMPFPAATATERVIIKT